MVTSGSLQRLRLVGFGTLFLIGVSLAGCDESTMVSVEPKLDRLPGVHPIPLSVGVYSSPDMRNYTHSANLNLPMLPGLAFLGEFDRTWYLSVGRATVPVLNETFARVFKEGTVLEEMPITTPGADGLNAVIEMKITNVVVKVLANRLLPEAFVRITCEFALYAPDGDLVAVWEVIGRGREEAWWPFASKRQLIATAATASLHDAATQLMTGVRRVPEVNAWFVQLGVVKA